MKIIIKNQFSAKTQRQQTQDDISYGDSPMEEHPSSLQDIMNVVDPSSNNDVLIAFNQNLLPPEDLDQNKADDQNNNSSNENRVPKQEDIEIEHESNNSHNDVYVFNLGYTTV